MRGYVVRVAVVGGTGLLGRHLAPALSALGHEPVVLARSTGVDITTGRGLADALRDVQTVVDLSNTATLRRDRSVAFFASGTQQLLAAGRRAGVGHHLVLSIVGVERVTTGYYAGKLAQEQLVLAGEVPGTVVRATQFHEFAGQLLAGIPGPVALVPRMRIQPIAGRELAGLLAELVQGPALGLGPEIAGPEVHQLADLARRLVAAQGRRRWVREFRVPGANGLRMAGGGLIPTGSGPRGTQTFDQWLAGAE